MAESGTGPTGPGPSIDPRLDTPLSIDEKQRREQEQQRALFLSRLSALMQQWERERNLPSTVNPQQDPASAGIASYDEERRKWERELDVIMQQWERSWNMPWTVKPKYGPAVAGLYWTKINAERFPAGQILSVVNLTFLSGVDVSDTSSAPGQLWEASLQYIASIPGCTYLKSASQEQEAVAVILWENCLSWKSFQQSTGFVRMAPILTQKMMNRSLRLPATVILGTKKYLQCIETTFEADLDSNARSRFEHQFLSIIEPYVTKHSLLASGWFENNASMYVKQKQDTRDCTHCTHIALFEFDDRGDHYTELSELATRLSQVSVLPHTAMKSSLSSALTYMDNPRPPSIISELTSSAQFSTLAGILQFPIRRHFSEEASTGLEWEKLPGVDCIPRPPFPLSQGSLYAFEGNLPLSSFGMLRCCAGPPLEPLMVDVAWLTTRSTLDRAKRRVSKMLNHQVRQLPGYVGGFWVCLSDSVHGFGVFTVWHNESARAARIREYREILDRFVDASSYMDIPPAHQSFPWARADEYGEPNRIYWHAPLVEVVTFKLPRDTMRRNLFECAFAGLRQITAPSVQSGCPPHACNVADAGGWAPNEPLNELSDEDEDRFTCFLLWRSDAARVPWYRNLGKLMCCYDTFSRWLDELKMFAELGVESRLVLPKDTF